MKKYNIKVNGKSYEVEVEEIGSGEAIAPVVTSVVKKEEAQPEKPAETDVKAGEKSIKAPMPGNIVKVNVKPGDTVKKGQVVLVLEAMKMENDITAQEDCTIVSIPAAQGKSVNTGDVLVTYN